MWYHPVNAEMRTSNCRFPHNIIGEAELASQLSKEQAEVESQKKVIKLLREQIENLKMQITRLESHLDDKDRIIKLLEERR